MTSYFAYVYIYILWENQFLNVSLLLKKKKNEIFHYLLSLNYFQIGKIFLESWDKSFFFFSSIKTQIKPSWHLTKKSFKKKTKISVSTAESRAFCIRSSYLDSELIFRSALNHWWIRKNCNTYLIKIRGELFYKLNREKKILDRKYWNIIFKCSKKLGRKSSTLSVRFQALNSFFLSRHFYHWRTINYSPKNFGNKNF